MASLGPTPHECTELLQRNLDVLLKVLNPAKWDKMTDDQRNSILYILKAAADTSNNLSEIAHAEALSRNYSIRAGAEMEMACEGTQVDAEGNTTEGASEYALEQREKRKFELERAAMECERVKAETAKLTAETERIKLEMEELKVCTCMATASTGDGW
ncbi:uncharacterized protein H6S33_003728 [Morchella sextelata]|uniref:uncharacterized protein n=1 Tax=Morchella sextelata TaxID=1174677 RepID=UPI001D03800F|nr:uncharacterized protein H6S33_003728 [Morchella sextelata]KAH0606894.1 hypothetical protein H6S33_003728 [Morchella sextelata]